MFFDLLRGHGLSFQTWNVVDGQFPTSPTDADGWLLTGSKHGAYEDHEFIPTLTQFIQATYATDQPMVGICFGHQIIAQALGGTVEKFDGGWAVGRQEYEFGNRTLALNAWHQDQVIQKPADADVFASNDFCKYAGLVYGKKAYTLQPHPEMSNAITSDYHTARKDSPLYPEGVFDHLVENITTPIQSEQIAKDIAAFFRGVFDPKVPS
ncbi:MAG: type 1 glutamine amidotransferase [Planktomarina sp.]